ncbi:MAG: hypothetical protein ACK4GR_04155, partial [bacterium]
IENTRKKIIEFKNNIESHLNNLKNNLLIQNTLKLGFSYIKFLTPYTSSKIENEIEKIKNNIETYKKLTNFLNIEKFIENLESVNEEQIGTFFHAFYNFLSLVFSKNLIQEDKLTHIIYKILIFQKNSEVLEKTLGISKEKSLQIINKIISKIVNEKEYLNYITTFILNNLDILQSETLRVYLESINLDQWIKIIDNGFTIKQELLLEVSTQTKNNLITAFIISKKFENIEKIVNTINEEEIEEFSDLAKILIKLSKNDYIYVFYNLTYIINYPELVWYIYQKLKSKVNQNILYRIFLGIFIFYMNEEEVDSEILEGIKKELEIISQSG